jgi:hypothetical protein
MVTQVVGSADANLVEKWDNKLKSCQQQRVAFERQWHENLLFYYGRQWIVTSKTTSGYAIVEQPQTDRWRVRHTANRILRIIRTEVTKLSKEEPQFYNVPKSTDEKDRLAAMAGDSIAEFILRTKYFNRKRLEATLWATICGTSFLKNYYDPNKTDIDGRPGRIDFDAVPAFHIFVPNLLSTELETQPYMIHARTMNPEDVYMMYGVELPPGTDASMIADARFMSATGIKNASNKQCYVKEIYAKPCKEYPNGAMFITGEGKVIYVYEPPAMPEMPGMQMDPAQMEMDPMQQIEELFKGITTAASPGKPPVGSPDTNAVDEQEPVGKPEESDLVAPQQYNYEYPYRHGQFPFAKIDHIPTGYFYAKSVVESLISPQKEYNRTRSITLEHRNLAAKPQWYYTAGAFDPKKFNSQPGLLLAINMGFEPPKPLEQPELPTSIDKEREIILADMDDISSQTEIAKGQTPPGVEAASAIAYLSEENDTVLYHTVQSIENAVQVTGIQVLANVHDYWDTDRIVRMTSKNQYMETREFKASDLNPIMDFRVEAGSMAPRSLAAKQAFITELMKMGAIEPNKALRYLQMSETDKLYDELMVDSRQAQRENVMMSQGQPLYKPDPEAQMQQNPMDPMGSTQPAYKMATVQDPSTGQDQVGQDGQPVQYQVTTNPYDAHDIHIEEHQKFQKSQEYELLPPQIQKIVQDHVDEHKMEMLKERNAVQADQAAKGQDPSTPQQPTPDVPPPREVATSSNGYQ